MDLSELSALREKLVEAMQSPNNENLSAVMGYFLDHFARYPEFRTTGDLWANGDIYRWMAEACRRFLGVVVDMNGTPLRRIGKYTFVHGGFNIQGRDGIVIYFEDVNRGLITIDVFDRYRCMPCPPGEDHVMSLDPHTNYAQSFRRLHGNA